jgi:hypothetical protein
LVWLTFEFGKSFEFFVLKNALKAKIKTNVLILNLFYLWEKSMHYPGIKPSTATFEEAVVCVDHCTI